MINNAYVSGRIHVSVRRAHSQFLVTVILTISYKADRMILIILSASVIYP